MRFLCLHGQGTRGEILEAQLAQIRSRLTGQHEFVFCDGDLECKPAPGIENLYSGPYYCHYELPTPVQMQSAFDLINEAIEEEGPFDGLVGFSQGAALAASFIIKESNSAEPTHPFKCAIFFCASVPFDPDSRPFTVSPDGVCTYADTKEVIPGFDLMSTMPEAADPQYSASVDGSTAFLQRYSLPESNKPLITIPTTHILGMNDGYRQQGLRFKGFCSPEKSELLEHGGGHEIPQDHSTTAKMVSCIQTTLQSVLR